jgi:PAS domain S-box-containing protein
MTDTRANAGASPPTSRFEGARAPIVALVALCLLAALGVIGVFRYASDERERDLRAWQDRLNLIADARLAAVEAWLGEQTGAVAALAGNVSVQLYMTELSLAGGDESAVTDAEAQRGYLRNLLLAAAQRDGFAAEAADAAIPANVERTRRAGLALLDGDGRLVLATPDMPDVDPAAATAARGTTATIDLHLGPDGAPAMGFIAPIGAIQGAGGEPPIGFVVGVKGVARELYPLLVQPGAGPETAETLLVREDGAALAYLSPLADGSRPLGRTLALDTPGLAEALAAAAPGGFVQGRDYRDAAVLATARRIAAVPWTLIAKVDAAEALAETEARQASLLTIFLLLIAGLMAVVIAAWRHGTSRREAQAAEAARRLAREIDAQRRFLKLVTDSQPNGIGIVDRAMTLVWANETMGRLVGGSTEAVEGKPLANVFGPVPARAFEAAVRAVLDGGGEREDVQVVERDGRPATFRSRFLPLADGGEPRVLAVIEDITPVVEARERRERLMRQLVSTLVKVIDRRDPFAADHSARVAEVAQAIARELEADRTTSEAASIAGQLMNLGKILVPESVLTKREKLADSELRLVRESLTAGVDLLEGVEFDGPVVPTLRQLQARWDGSGVPAGLAGEAILLPARIVAVANAFVGMVSARAWRAGVPIATAIEQLQADHGRAFDPRVVLALANHVANHGGAAAWAHFGRAPERG